MSNLRTLIRFIKPAIRRLGFDLVRYHPDVSEAAQTMAMLTQHRVNVVFDVGANTGHFGQRLREAGYRGRIVSFEPLSVAWAQLRNACEKDLLWEIAPRCAIGSEDAEVTIHIAANSSSSSVLDMLDVHGLTAPQSRYVGSEQTPVRRLDSFAEQYLRSDSVTFLKIDTQGYEDRVLQGASSLLSSVSGLQVELSLVPLYKEQLLFKELVDNLSAKGFALWSVRPVFVDHKTGRVLQVDATFFRDESAS